MLRGTCCSFIYSFVCSSSSLSLVPFPPQYICQASFTNISCLTPQTALTHRHQDTSGSIVSSSWIPPLYSLQRTCQNCSYAPTPPMTMWVGPDTLAREDGMVWPADWLEDKDGHLRGRETVVVRWMRVWVWVWSRRLF
jgi:hypothetical protein